MKKQKLIEYILSNIDKYYINYDNVIKYNKSTNDIITILCCSTNPLVNNLNKPIFEPEEFERLILTFNL